MRIYVIASAQHNSPFGSEPVKEDTQQLVNPLPAGDVLRALMVALDLWVTQGISPPPSRYPRVRMERWCDPSESRRAFPTYAAFVTKAYIIDSFSWIMARTLVAANGRPSTAPERQWRYTILVPRVDRDGNDSPGIRLPAVQVPIGTYTGWNLQSRRLAEDELSGLLGSFIPFAKTKAERSKRRDPRLSLQERYKSPSDYVKKISHAARILVDQRYLLPDDAQRMIDEAKKRRVP